MEKMWTEQRGKCIFLILILCAALFLFLWNLGNQYLWHDEAQTALVSKTILTHGIPLGYDGKNYFSQELGHEYGENYIWKWQPWLPFYLLAGTFKIFGISTFTARVPFALFGVATTLLTYFFTKILTRDKKTAAVAVISLILSVSFLILSRQCRYYSLAAFFSLLGLYGYVMMLDKKRAGLIFFGLSAILIFHCHILFCATLLATVSIHALLCRRPQFVKVFLLSVAVVLINLPWFIWSSGMKYAALFGCRLFDKTFFSYLKEYLLSIHRYIFPVFLLLIPLGKGIFPWIKHRNIKSAVSGNAFLWKNVLLLVLFALCTVVALSMIGPFPYFRYMAQLIPVFCIITAIILTSIMRPYFKTSAVIIVFLFAGVFFADYLYEKAHPDRDGIKYLNFFDYIDEISHDYDGPLEGISSYLNKHGSKDDIVAIAYGDMPLKFYTNMRVIGGLTREDLSLAKDADWVILRKYVMVGENARVRQYLAENIPRDHYEEIIIDYPDIPFENRESPEDHRFRTAVDEDRVVIYRRRR